MPGSKNQPSIFYGCTELSYNQRNDEDGDPNTPAWESKDGRFFADRAFLQITLSQRDGDSRQDIAGLPEDIGRYSAVYIDPLDLKNFHLFKNGVEIGKKGMTLKRYMAHCSEAGPSAAPAVSKDVRLSESAPLSLKDTKGEWKELSKGQYAIRMRDSGTEYGVEGYSLRINGGQCELIFQLKGKRYSTTFPVTPQGEKAVFTLYFRDGMPFIAAGQYKYKEKEKPRTQNVFTLDVEGTVAADKEGKDADKETFDALMDRLMELSPSDADAFYEETKGLPYKERIDAARAVIEIIELSKGEKEEKKIRAEDNTDKDTFDALMDRLMDLSPSDADAFYEETKGLSYKERIDAARAVIEIIESSRKEKIAKGPESAKEAEAKVEERRTEPAKKVEEKKAGPDARRDEQAVRDYYKALGQLDILFDAYLEPEKAAGPKDIRSISEATHLLENRRGEVKEDIPHVKKSFDVAKAQAEVIFFSEGPSDYSDIESEADLDKLIDNVMKRLKRGEDDELIGKLNALKEFKRKTVERLKGEEAARAAEEEAKKARDEEAKRIADESARKENAAKEFRAIADSPECKCALDMNCEEDRYSRILSTMEKLKKIDIGDLESPYYGEYRRLVDDLDSRKRIFEGAEWEKQNRNRPENIIKNIQEHEAMLYQHMVQKEASKADGVRYDFKGCPYPSYIEDVIKVFGRGYIERLVITVKAKEPMSHEEAIIGYARKYGLRFNVIYVDNTLPLEGTTAAINDTFDIRVFSKAIDPKKAREDADAFSEEEKRYWDSAQADAWAKRRKETEEKERAEKAYKDDIDSLYGIKIKGVKVTKQTVEKGKFNNTILMYVCPVGKLDEFLAELQTREERISYLVYKINPKTAAANEAAQKIGGAFKTVEPSQKMNKTERIRVDTVQFVIIPRGSNLRKNNIDF